MYCTSCGTWNQDDAIHCSNCGNPMPAAYAANVPATISTHLLEAILVTLCCCMPFGIVAIVFATQVSSKLQAGDIQGALQASKNAKTWAWVGFGAGLAVALGYALLVALGVLADPALG
jgi:hypothetical protein